jgi:glycosyltransferase involved in cell wall biosynthesis
MPVALAAEPTVAAARVFVLIPAWNEEETIAAVVQDAIAAGAKPRVGLRSWNVIVIDNGSTDRTGERARRAGARVVMESRRGYGQACLAGIAASARPDEVPGGWGDDDIIVFMDGDGSDDPREIGSLLAPLLAGEADLVIGSRELGISEIGAHPWHAVYGTRICVLMMNALIGTRATDLGPFRAIRRDALRRLEMEDTSFGWTVEMQVKARRAGLSVLEAPVNYRRRRGGDSKISGSPVASLRAGASIISFILKQAFRPGPA